MWVVDQAMGKNKERSIAPTYPSLGHNLDLIFRGCCISTAEDFFHFGRSWKIVPEFLRLTMVVLSTVRKLKQAYTGSERRTYVNF
jgi:hypothetical protein